MAVTGPDNIPLRPGNPEVGSFTNKAARSGRGYGEVRTFSPDNEPLDGLAGNTKQVGVGKSKPTIP